MCRIVAGSSCGIIKILDSMSTPNAFIEPTSFISGVMTARDEKPRDRIRAEILTDGCDVALQAKMMQFARAAHQETKNCSGSWHNDFLIVTWINNVNGKHLYRSKSFSF